MNKPIFTAVTCAAVVASMALATPALAGERGDHESPDTPVTPGTPTTLVGELTSPLSLWVDEEGNALVSQNFVGLLTGVDSAGATSEIVSAPGNEIGAVSSREGTIYFAQNAVDLSTTMLMSLPEGGSPTELADLRAWEESENPDQVNDYGFEGLDQACLDQFPTGPMMNPGSYSGLVDSHPYASLPLDEGIYVADAGGNTIVKVDYDGTVSTTAVLPASDPILVTAELAAAAGFPECAADHYYSFEPVPTDVAQGEDGLLYVTTLPGGPEDASLGARGAVYTVEPDSGDVELYATGFAGATGLAIADSGAIYVVEMFGGEGGTGQVSVVPEGDSSPTPFIALTSPAAIALQGDSLYVTTDAFIPDATGNPQPIGKITVVPLEGGDNGDNHGHGHHGDRGDYRDHGGDGHASSSSWGGHR